MSLKSIAARLFAKKIARKTRKWANSPIHTQEKLFRELIKKASQTRFGKDHNFSEIKSHTDFVRNVPVRDYEEFKDYIKMVLEGKEHVLWPGKPIYFAKTSGTTSGVKYIPITAESIKHQINGTRDALLTYINETGEADFVDGKMIFLQGSPELDQKNGIKIGRLSGIAAHYVPNYLQKNRLPSWKTNCIEDWDAKVNEIVKETLNEDMTVIGGIPPWVQMYFEKLNHISGNKVGNQFKNLKLFVYGGVNFEPYRSKFENLIGRKLASIELFPASEGFFAYQNSQTEKGMLLLLNSGVFYEFIKADEFFKEKAERLTLERVEIGVNYVMIISTNAGLWAYNLGDTIQFISVNPFRIIVSGRIKHYISAFGEHVIGKEIDEAMQTALSLCGGSVNEFTVAPQITPENSELPYHEWFIEFETMPENLSQFIEILDRELQKQNSYYFDLIEGKILQPLKITQIETGGFTASMKSSGKLGGQNKVQRLANDRKLADALAAFIKR